MPRLAAHVEAAAAATSMWDNATAMKLATAPIALAGLGIFCSIIGVFFVKAKEDASFSQLLKSLHMGVWTASALIAAASAALLSRVERSVDIGRVAARTRHPSSER